MLLYALVLGVVYLRCGSIPSPLWWIGAAFIGFIAAYVEYWIPARSAQKKRKSSILEGARQVIVPTVSSSPATSGSGFFNNPFLGNR